MAHIHDLTPCHWTDSVASNVLDGKPMPMAVGVLDLRVSTCQSVEHVACSRQTQWLRSAPLQQRVKFWHQAMTTWGFPRSISDRKIRDYIRKSLPGGEYHEQTLVLVAYGYAPSIHETTTQRHDAFVVLLTPSVSNLRMASTGPASAANTAAPPPSVSAANTATAAPPPSACMPPSLPPSPPVSPPLSPQSPLPPPTFWFVTHKAWNALRIQVLPLRTRSAHHPSASTLTEPMPAVCLQSTRCTATRPAKASGSKCGGHTHTADTTLVRWAPMSVI